MPADKGGGSRAIAPDTRHMVQTIQQDWEDRELIETVQMNILAITAFLNKIDTSTRYKLARINEKLAKLERTLDFCESAVKTTLETE
ncbi:hypothetical protein CTAYLR_006565 [Chrysophaeum taylorii]|uniref:Protein BRICK1 n=1 Tax=Chrysophaeum taylorii TaxID=2483200 RepID=A0AAD7UGX7_9STRA|nr:hypothetical protein CTAYLR_006565 [Chrysophaeum taylorii]